MKTKLHREIDGLLDELKKSGHDIKRTTLIESLAKARGFRNAHEMMKQAKTEKPVETLEETEVSAADYLSGEKTEKRRTAQKLNNALALIEQLKSEVRSAHILSNFDWPRWKKTIKAIKAASHHSAEPIDDEKLMLIRKAVSDNHCKSSASERSEARYRVGQLGEKLMASLLVRLDKAEEMLGKGEIIDEPVINALWDVWEVEAGRDGDSFTEHFIADKNDHLDAQQQGVLVAAKAFDIDNIWELTGIEDMTVSDAIEEMEADMDFVRVREGNLQIPIKDAIKALKKGEGSLLLHDTLRQLAYGLGVEQAKIKMT